MRRVYVAMATLICLAGCKSELNAPSIAEKSIIQKLVDAGLNPSDLKQADAAGMQIWLGQHPEAGKSIASQCKAAMKDDMSWKLSEEGRICLGDKFAGYIN
ncbi:MAG TPA: hypothetical protein VK638_48225 [Edaphobacter sp.]|nr:hypothetical protein [Edaphobacter sp.]